MESREILMEMLNHSYSVFKSYQSGDPEKKAAREAILRIAELINELDETSTESWVKQESLRIDEDKNKAQAVLKEKEIEAGREENWLNLAKDGIRSISLGWIIGKVLKYEETGVITSKAFQILTGFIKLK